jgi:hypothetical protein
LVIEQTEKEYYPDATCCANPVSGYAASFRNELLYLYCLPLVPENALNSIMHQGLNHAVVNSGRLVFDCTVINHLILRQKSKACFILLVIFQVNGFTPAASQ